MIPVFAVFAVISSASFGLSTAANNLSLNEGQRIIALKHQFPSHTYPWKRKARESGGVFIEVDVPQGVAATPALLQAIDERTAIVAVPNVLWTTGAYVDLIAIRQRCDEVGAALVLDLTQSAGALVTAYCALRAGKLKRLSTFREERFDCWGGAAVGTAEA